MRKLLNQFLFGVALLMLAWPVIAVVWTALVLLRLA
jgi:hypothetical protein